MKTSEVRFALAAVLLGALFVGGVAGCGAGESKSASVPTASEEQPAAAPEELRATDAVVAAGLGVVKGLANDTATALSVDKAKAQDSESRIEGTWQGIEGTIKANSPDAYLAFEDNFAVLGDAVSSGDSARARTAADAVAAAADTYLAARPTATPTATAG